MAEHIFIRGEGGSVWKMDLPLHESVEDRLLKGHLTRVANEAGDPYLDGGDGVSALPTERPALNANKATWVGWAVHEGMTPDDAEAATKTDLIEKFGATAPEKTADETAADAAAPEATDQAADDAPTPDDAEAAPAADAPAGE